jgi:hypothetical protein
MKKPLPVLLCLLLSSLWCSAKDFEFYPGVSYDESIPTLESVVGHPWGENISSHAEIESYIRALSDRSDKVLLREYGRTWEGRALYLLIVGSERNLGRLDEIRAGTRRLAYPSAATESLEELPATVWLAYGVHGNEISSPDAALLTAYHLAAARNDDLVDAILADCIVLIDPLQNPDGRDRFVHHFRQNRGRWPDADPHAAERNEIWPRGRSNHYLFDLNRDWFALTQPETRGRVAVYLEWFPQVVVDLHEMGGDSTYYFPPPADPVNPFLDDSQLEWLERFGRNNAAWFDRLRIDYFTREIFDSFYPGYGESWPMFHGAIGMTYEQASVRGLVLERQDRTTIHFRESVRNQFIASLSTLESAARNREGLLRDFHEFRRSAVQEGSGGIREFLLPPGRDPSRVVKLINLLLAQGVEVRRSEQAFVHPQVSSLTENRVEERSFPAGTFVVPLAQPAGRLARTLLSRETPMGEDFLAEQERLRRKRMRDQIYDVTAWSMPLLFDVEAFAGQIPSPTETVPVDGRVEIAGGLSAPASLAYLVPWGSNSAGQLLGALHRRDLRVYSSSRPFTIRSARFPAGSLIVRTRDNPEDLAVQLAELAAESGVSIIPTDSGWVETGVNLGSNHVRFLPKPGIAMAYGEPTRSTSAGAVRYLLEQVYGFPLTAIYTADLGRADLRRYNVIVLPDASGAQGGYSGVLGETGVERLKSWIREGGTLIALGAAGEWLTFEKVGLLSTGTEQRQLSEDSPPEPAENAGDSVLDVLIRPDDEPPDLTPGAIVRVRLDPEHWLAFGYGEQTLGVVASRRIFTPLKLDKGRNVGVYAPADRLLVSGLMWDDARAQLADKAFLMHERYGRGNVVAFAEDPSFRAYVEGQHLLLVNAVFFGPAN